MIWLKILKFKLESYLYANSINREYWARLDDNKKDYEIIPETKINTTDVNDKCNISEDSKVSESSEILLNAYTKEIKLNQ